MFGRKRMDAWMEKTELRILDLERRDRCSHTQTKLVERYYLGLPVFEEVCTYCGKKIRYFDTHAEFMQAQIGRKEEELKRLKGKTIEEADE